MALYVAVHKADEHLDTKGFRTYILADAAVQHYGGTFICQQQSTNRTILELRQ
jgi:hypothetical protein